MGSTPDFDDDALPGDEAPPEAEGVPADRQPQDPPSDEGNAEAERKTEKEPHDG